MQLPLKPKPVAGKRTAFSKNKIGKCMVMTWHLNYYTKILTQTLHTKTKYEKDISARTKANKAVLTEMMKVRSTI